MERSIYEIAILYGQRIERLLEELGARGPAKGAGELLDQVKDRLDEETVRAVRRFLRARNKVVHGKPLEMPMPTREELLQAGAAAVAALERALSARVVHRTAPSTATPLPLARLAGVFLLLPSLPLLLLALSEGSPWAFIPGALLLQGLLLLGWPPEGGLLPRLAQRVLGAGLNLFLSAPALAFLLFFFILPWGLSKAPAFLTSLLLLALVLLFGLGNRTAFLRILGGIEVLTALAYPLFGVWGLLEGDEGAPFLLAVGLGVGLYQAFPGLVSLGWLRGIRGTPRGFSVFAPTGQSSPKATSGGYVRETPTPFPREAASGPQPPREHQQGGVDMSEGRVRIPGRGQAPVPLDKLEEALKERIIGQDHVVKAVVKGLRRREAGLSTGTRPFSALFAGPTGTGKTEMAKALAELLGRPFLRYDMNQYHDRYTASALVGSPPGYMGSDRPGRLVEDLNSAPDAVVLFDEIEKADPRVLDSLLQLMDEGYTRELSQGLIARAPGALLIFTTNLLQGEDLPFSDEATIRGRLVSRGLRPEFVNRMGVVALFRPFDEETLEKVVRKAVSDYIRAWAKAEGLSLEVQVDPSLHRALLSFCDTRFGARDVQRAVENYLGDALAEAYLPLKREGRRPSRLTAGVEGGEIVVRLD